MMTKKNEKSMYVYEYKRGIGCEGCDATDPDILEFHHILPHNKVADISDMVSGPYTLDEIISEISKCMVQCSNCHSKRHREQEFSSRMMNQDTDYNIED